MCDRFTAYWPILPFTGFLFIRYPELMLEQDSKLLYQEWLTKDQASKKKCQVCACTVEYRQSAPHRLSAPPPPPIFPHRKNRYRECAPPHLSPPFSERPPSRYLASDAPTMHNEVPKCA